MTLEAVCLVLLLSVCSVLSDDSGPSAVRLPLYKRSFNYYPIGGSAAAVAEKHGGSKKLKAAAAQTTSAYWQAYSVEMRLGNPPQRLNLTMDMSRYDSYVFSSGLKERSCDVASSPRKLYNPARSTTYHALSKSPYDMSVYDPYVTTCPKILPADSDTRGVDATDDVLIGNTTVKSAKFNAVEQIFGIATPGWPDAGILGMVWQDFFRDFSSLMLSVTNAFDYDGVTIFVDKNDSALTAGVLTVGSNKDPFNCDDNWNVMKLDTVDLISWNVRLDNFYFGSIQSYGAQLSFTMEPHIGITEDIFSDVISNLGAWVDPATGDYTLPCNVSHSAADFVFEMDGASYNVSAKDYIRNEMPVRNNGMCTLFLKNTFEPAEGFFGWYVGVPFLRNICVSLKYGWNTISLATVKRK